MLASGVSFGTVNIDMRLYSLRFPIRDHHHDRERRESLSWFWEDCEREADFGKNYRMERGICSGFLSLKGHSIVDETLLAHICCTPLG